MLVCITQIVLLLGSQILGGVVAASVVDRGGEFAAVMCYAMVAIAGYAMAWLLNLTGLGML